MKLLHPRSVAFFKHFAGAYPGRTLAMVVLQVVSGILEGISVIALVPLLEVAAAPEDGSTSAIGNAVESALRAVGLEPTMGVLVGTIVLGITLKSVFLWLAMRQVGFTVSRVTLDLRIDLVRALLRARWGYFGRQPLGSFANSIAGEAVRSAAAYREACVVLGGALQIIIYLVISALISWQVTVVALVTGLVLSRALQRLVAIGRFAGEQQTRLTRNLASSLVDALQGIKPMKAMAREELFAPLLEGEAEGVNQAQRRTVVASESLRLFQEPIVTLVLGLGLVALLSMADRSFSAIIVLAFVFYRLMTNINTLQKRYQVMAVGESAFWSMQEQIDEARAAEEHHPGTVRPSGLREGIELRSISFSYGDLQVLDELSVTIPARAITALIGRSGSGKTTIVDLVTGLHRPASGEVYIDGVPLAELDLREWRNLIGYVPQDTFLFHDTVRRNVTLGDDAISDERVERALQEAGAWDFVVRDAQGIHAVIAPQASNLSGGQRQRLAIARALVRNPALIVLDEATTGLDTRTEAAILETLVSLRGRVTILAISHQPALRRIADVTIELDGGKILQTESASLEPAEQGR